MPRRLSVGGPTLVNLYWCLTRPNFNRILCESARIRFRDCRGHGRIGTLSVTTFAGSKPSKERTRGDYARGETVASEVVINDDLLWGSVFRYEPSMPPEELAAIFHNYNGQCRYVPGMPVTQVINQTGKLHRVFHRINPVTFFADGAQKSWPEWLYNAMCYSYQLDEEVFSTPTDTGPGYAIRWTIPLETQVMGARENGEIMFTKMGEGTLMSYNNATEPFGYKRLKKLLPSGTLTKLYLWMGTIASD